MLPHLACLAFLSITCTAVDALPTATIDAGVVIGTTTSLPSGTAHVDQFLGIPYAVSPPKRFSPPQKPAKFNETIPAQKLSAACIQYWRGETAEEREALKLVFNNPGGDPPKESEDCLYLNVYTPSTPPPTGGRAVMAWIHGGALQAGSAVYDFTDGSSFAAFQDVIVVTFNYRTNVFGFPSSTELPLADRNLGFLDQRLALEWIQTNIAAFGGSPEKVTVFGESSGGQSVDALIITFGNGTLPPFRGGILQPGQASYQIAPPADPAPAWRTLSREMGCCSRNESCDNTLDCVREASVDDILSVLENQGLDFQPAADNITYVSDPVERRATGNIAQVPVLGGTNSGEGRSYAVGVENATRALWELGLEDINAIETILDAVPLGQNGINTPSDQVSQILTELVFQCPMALFINASSAVGIPTWRYYYDASFPNLQPVPSVELGAFHSSEISIVFGTYPETNATAKQKQLSRVMQTAWADFAKDPEAGPGWSSIGGGDDYRGGVAVLDTADNSTSAAAFKEVDQSTLDSRCELYAAISID